MESITNYREYLKIIGEDPCVVKFTAKWCGPCKRLAPIFEELTKDNTSGVRYIEIDIDHADEITNHENIQGVPTVVFYKNGKLSSELGIIGFNSSALIRNVKSFIKALEADKELEAVTYSTAIVSVDDEPEDTVEISLAEIVSVDDEDTIEISLAEIVSVDDEVEIVHTDHDELDDDAHEISQSEIVYTDDEAEYDISDNEDAEISSNGDKYVASDDVVEE